MIDMQSDVSLWMSILSLVHVERGEGGLWLQSAVLADKSAVIVYT